jgi:RNA polymerase sigma-70 factor (ECF subfamily)
MPGRQATVWDWAGARRICLAEARKVLGTGPAAEDAAQDAVLRAWRRRSTCREPHRPGPWLRQIARNEALRTAARTTERSLETPLVADEASTSSPLDDLIAREMLTRLAPLDRQLLFMQHWEDAPIKEIAFRLRMPEGTVKIRLHRARMSLREMIERKP